MRAYIAPNVLRVLLKHKQSLNLAVVHTQMCDANKHVTRDTILRRIP